MAQMILKISYWIWLKLLQKTVPWETSGDEVFIWLDVDKDEPIVEFSDETIIKSVLNHQIVQGMESDEEEAATASNSFTWQEITNVINSSVKFVETNKQYMVKVMNLHTIHRFV